MRIKHFANVDKRPGLKSSFSPNNCSESRFRTGVRNIIIILQNIRGNMIYLFRDYIEIPLVGLLHTTGRRFLICKNIKNGNKFCLFLQQ